MKLGYPIKHWLTSLVIGPTIMIIYDTIYNSKLMNDAVGVYFLFVAFGLFFSLPTFILYALTYNSIIKTDKSNFTIKTILIVLGILGIVVTFSLIKGTLTMKASIFYSIGLIIGSLFYKVRPKEIKEQTIDG
jgi:Sec-independent protein secretion pathway component TatC